VTQYGINFDTKGLRKELIEFTMKRKPLIILTIFGTRPEVIKLFPILEQLRLHAMFNNLVVCTSQHREMVDDLFTFFSIKVDYDLKIMPNNQSLADISIRSLFHLDPILKKHRPDLVLVQGDTTTAFIGALTAFYNKIPVGHVEAGLRSFDTMHPYPEEINRRLISLIANLHFAPTATSAENLFNEGIDPSRIFITGNTVIDSLLYIINQKHNTLNHYLPDGVLNSHRMILVTAHRRENWGQPLENLCYALMDIVQSHRDVQIVYPIHLNPNVRETVFKILSNQERIHLLDPLPYEPFVEAMTKAHLIITDSGGIQEEGVSLRKPILVFRKVTERPEGIESGGVKLIGLEKRDVVQETSRLLEDPGAYQKMIADYNPFGDGKAAQRVVKAILNYFHIGGKIDVKYFIYPGKLSRKRIRRE
jgi:UDP-N-acetylglucosamine 2-epimerase (non-hydrolysing)